MLTRGDLSHVSKNGFSVGHVCMQEMKYGCKSYTCHVKDSVSIPMGRTETWIIQEPQLKWGKIRKNITPK